jgi:aldehyde dehydrogenase (NAD+)
LTAIDVARGHGFEARQGSALIVKEPVGVCGLMTPWNWPANPLNAKVAPALAAVRARRCQPMPDNTG